MPPNICGRSATTTSAKTFAPSISTAGSTTASPKKPAALAFWLEYWVVGYRHLLAQEGGLLRFVNYDALCEDPERGLRAVADAIGCRDCDALLAAASGIHAARPREVDTQAVSASLLGEVDRVYARLREVAVNSPRPRS